MISGGGHGAPGMAEHLSQSELDYPFKLLEYFNGFRVSKVIFSACELGVFDLLLRSQEPVSARHVAEELSTSVDGMERLLDALVGIEILEVETADGTALYSSTDVANLYLAKGSAKSLHDMIIYQSQTIYPLWNNMVDAVRFNKTKNNLVPPHREGRNQNEKTFGLPPEEVFQAIYRSEEEMLKFMGLMNSSWVLDGHDIVTAFNLSSFQTIVDLGGCTGALARELVKAYPSSSVMVFDLPQVVESAQKHFSQENDSVVFQSGDFFSGDVPAADLYVLARIIHDWPEEKCLTLLKKIHNTCRPGGGVLLVEAMLFENRRGPVMAQIFSLNMLVQAEGRERRPSEYTHMLKTSGFHNVQCPHARECRRTQTTMKRSRHPSSSDDSDNGSNSTCWSQHSSQPRRGTGQKPSEVFRTDLITAMKVHDSYQLNPEDYYVLADPWRQEWEKGVQVPVSPQSIPQPVARVLAEKGKEVMFVRPKKLIRTSGAEALGYVDIRTLAEGMCRYDLNEEDVAWLHIINEEFTEMAMPLLDEITMERVMEEFERRCHDNMTHAMETEEGLGIEYDEDVVCDVCQSPDGEDNNEMVFCDKCNICVHQACYGIQKVPKGSWLCRICALGILPKCQLCPKKGGAMKPTRSGTKWVHVSCALWIPEVTTKPTCTQSHSVCVCVCVNIYIGVVVHFHKSSMM
ncbi:hypothetical protein INR49_018783 [Caranx melampygus]|nr:hypothetical protein INR49_018783 [Caranx melampygus]